MGVQGVFLENNGKFQDLWGNGKIHSPYEQPIRNWKKICNDSVREKCLVMSRYKKWECARTAKDEKMLL